MIFPGFPGVLPFFQIFQVKWETWILENNSLCSTIIGQVGVTAKVKVTNVITHFANNLKAKNYNSTK